MTNPTLELLSERRSIRAFTGEAVPDADLAEILRVTLQAPSSYNGQQVTLVVVRDPARIAAIAELAGGQAQVASADTMVIFCVDYTRAEHAAASHGGRSIIAQTADGVLVGAVDAGIALATFQTAAASMGYGTTPIGGVRLDPQGLIDLLELPPLTFPLVGSTLGVPDEARRPQAKPRLPLASVALPERYDAEAVRAGIDDYDAELRAWWDAQGLTQMPSYTDMLAGVVGGNRFDRTGVALRSQGFDFLDAVS